MHQSMCFGFLINDREAFLYIMEHDVEKRKINVSRLMYSFLFPGYPHNKFFSDGLKNMFIDIVALLTYGKSNITEIKHKFEIQTESQ